MSVSLIGIVLLQVYWIRHDYQMKEQQFDRQVQDALNHTIQKADTRQVLNFISRKYLGFESDSNFWKAMDSTLAEKKIFEEDLMLKNADSSFSEQLPLSETNVLLRDSIFNRGHSQQEKLIIRSDSLHEVTEIDHVRITEKQSAEDKMVLKNELLQAEVEKKRIRLEQELTRMKVKLSSKVARVNEVMTGIALSYAASEDDPLQHISIAEIDTILSKEFRYRGIEIPYSFGILNSKADTVISGRDTITADALRQSRYSIELFPNELYSKGLMLLVHFPSRAAFVLGTMWIMLSASALFTLTIIFVFIYTVNMLLKQKKISEIKSDFINNMTHEFKTPIATIALAIDAINNPKISADKEKVGYYSNIIREENRRMNRQVETILQTAMFEKSDFNIKKDTVNLHELIQKATDNIRVQVASRNGTIITSFNSASPIIEGDELLLTTAIVNLLDNANKYSPGEPEITVTTEDREHGIVLSIADKGMGMDKETMERIFEKFYRKTSGNIHDVKGFGLGLNHVKSIVNAHGGEIKVTSEPGKGSCFSIYFPKHINLQAS
ncbi:MAG: HAMP domain-containing histidine kinase [Bacteroidia bacterium]|nr:HAMP domain-containing histidine kinase [Bacteroidia bacterium]